MIIDTGDFPRKLTQDEVEEIKARAMTVIGDKIGIDLPHIVFNAGDQFKAIYTVNMGPKQYASRITCGAVPPTGGPACNLEKGHDCSHSSVKRW